MKNLFLSLLTCLFFLPATGQKITIKNEVVFKDGEPYCKLLKQGSIGTPRLSVRSLEAPDEELIVAQYNSVQKVYKVTFLESGAVSTMSATIGFAKMFAEDLVYNNVVEAGKVTPKGEMLFLRQHEGTVEKAENKELLPGLKKAISGLEDALSDILSDGPSVDKTNERTVPYETVERDHTRPVTVAGSEIKQGFAVIGKWSAAQTATDGKVIRTLFINFPDGQTVAEATLDALKPTEARVVIMKNNQVVNLPVTTFTETDQVAQLATYLSGRFLL